MFIAAVKDLRRQCRDLGALSLWLGVPIVVGSLITLASGGRSGPQPVAHVLVADHDDSFLSGMLRRALSGQGESSVIRAESVEEAAGRARLRDGEASALLVIPAGFGKAVLEEQPCELTLVENPAQRILPGIVESMLAIVSEGAFYGQRLFGDELRAIAAGPPKDATTFPDAVVAAFSVEINRAVRRLEKYLLPPAIELDVTAPELDATAPSYALAFLPGIVLMALFFTAQGISQDLWRERQLGTFRRVAAGPVPRAALLFGKVLAGGTIGAMAAAGALGVGFAYHGVPFDRLPGAIVWSALAAVLLLLFVAVIQLWARSARAGNILVTAVTFPLLMIGGSFFPFVAMPAWMAAIGRLTPNGLLLVGLERLVRGQATPADFAAACSIALAVAALLALVCARRFRRVFAVQ